MVNLNKTALDLFEFESFDEVKEYNAADYYVNPDDRLMLLNEYKSKGFVKNFQTQLKTKSGKIIYTLGSGCIIHLENKEPFLLNTIKDITQLKQAEQALKQSEEELRILNAGKDRFMSILGHDLRSPLNSILGFSDLLVKNLHHYDIGKIEKQIKIINQTANKTYNLLEDLLLWSKSQSKKLAIEPQEIVFADICNDVINNFKTRANLKDIIISCFDSERTILTVDLNMFKTILRNLISNAIKFTNKNGQITIYSERKGENIIITISDNGVGIEKENIPKLWDFTQPISTSGTANETGTGFGLLLCKEFVEKHGGKIWVESEVGKGSDFKFTIPLNN
ncbi:MAG: GHKL domain-containing protein [Bacteroidales bacterium]|nr:GHKL domain-containing protein [Bacteroidales bacterium]